MVCVMTPSSAATTKTTKSVTCAPRLRIALNAAWPGVSRNVILSPDFNWTENKNDYNRIKSRALMLTNNNAKWNIFIFEQKKKKKIS